MTMVIRAISCADILDAPNAPELMAEYAAECSLKELGEICPQRAIYEVMESSQSMRCFGVFAGETLIGFAAVLFYVVPHYGKRVAMTESIFVADLYRAQGIGSKLMDFIEQFAKQEGCVAFFYSAPVGSRLERLLYARNKCRHSNSIFLRALE